MNPFINWVNGYTWICNLCITENPLDEHLQDFKTKLNVGSYEFSANASYTDRPPMPPTYLFIIDTSQNSIDSGFFISIIETIRYIFTNNLFSNVDRTKVGFITYDNTVNFFKFNVNNKSGSDLPQMFRVNDFSDEESFLPVPVNKI